LVFLYIAIKDKKYQSIHNLIDFFNSPSQLLHIKQITAKWNQPMQNWALTISQLDILFPKSDFFTMTQLKKYFQAIN